MYRRDSIEGSKMRYPESTPLVFSGAKSFVENNGMRVWCEVCDTIPLGKWHTITEAAQMLESVNKYRNPTRYLKAVLLAIREDMKERPAEYADYKPFIPNEGLQFTKFML